MTRDYEVVYVFDSTLEETQINERLERFHALLTGPESPEPVTAISHWGKRTLAYLIDGKDTGYYVVVQFRTEPTLLGEMERAIKLDESVMRYLIVLNEGLTPVGAGPSPEEERASKTDDDEGDDE
jgi:small subunit ribosomal protein S6